MYGDVPATAIASSGAIGNTRFNLWLWLRLGRRWGGGCKIAKRVGQISSFKSNRLNSGPSDTQ